jgi:hypothetical protein
MRKPTLTDQLVMALAELEGRRPGAVTVADLSVRVWVGRKKAWGLRGYSEFYPDHNRTSACLCSKRGPVRAGLIERPRSGYVKLTALGRIRAAQLEGRG